MFTHTATLSNGRTGNGYHDVGRKPGARVVKLFEMECDSDSTGQRQFKLAF